MSTCTTELFPAFHIRCHAFLLYFRFLHQPRSREERKGEPLQSFLRPIRKADLSFALLRIRRCAFHKRSRRSRSHMPRRFPDIEMRTKSCSMIAFDHIPNVQFWFVQSSLPPSFHGLGKQYDRRVVYVRPERPTLCRVTGKMGFQANRERARKRERYALDRSGKKRMVENSIAGKTKYWHRSPRTKDFKIGYSVRVSIFNYKNLPAQIHFSHFYPSLSFFFA